MAMSGLKKCALGVVFACLAWGLGAQNYDITKQLTGSGHTASGGSYELQGSSGQVVVGATTGGDYAVSAGYWRSNTDLIFKDDIE